MPKATPAQPDPKIEAMLTEHHVTFTFDPAFPLARIDVTRSLQNQARVGDALDDDTVETYVASYKRGDTFPPLIANKPTPGSRKRVLVGGNHRIAAAIRAGRTIHGCYLIEAEPETALLLSYIDNSRHGRPPSKKERLAQAAHLVDTGYQNRQAAAICGVLEPELSNWRTAAKSGRRASELGVALAWDGIGATQTRLHLSGIQMDGPFTEAVALVAAAQMSATDTKRLVDNLRKAGSEEQQLQVIGAELEERRSDLQHRAGRKGPRVTPFGSCKHAVLMLLSIDAGDVDASAPTPDAKAGLRKNLLDLGPAVRKLMDALT